MLRVALPVSCAAAAIIVLSVAKLTASTLERGDDVVRELQARFDEMARLATDEIQNISALIAALEKRRLNNLDDPFPPEQLATMRDHRAVRCRAFMEREEVRARLLRAPRFAIPAGCNPTDPPAQAGDR